MDSIKFEDEVKSILCNGCLSSDRRVSLIRDGSALFFNLLGNQHHLTFNDTKDLTLCWECIAMLRKIQTFQTRIRNAQIILLQSLCQMNQPLTLSTLTRTYKDTYDFTLDEVITEIENKDELNNLDEIKKEQVTEEDELFKVITKEENDYSDTDYTPETTEITEIKTHSTTVKKECKNKEIKALSIKKYQKYATVTIGEKLNANNLGYYFSKVNLSDGEMEAFMAKERKERSYERMPYKCKVCKLGYKRRVDYNRHNACKHNESPPYRCTQCRSTSGSFSELVEHWRVHSAMLKCNKCGNLSRSPGELRKHVNRAHCNIFTCNKCGGEFSTLREFSNHYKKHHERVICDYCSKTFRIKKSLEIHIKRHHLPAYCPICRRTYRNYHALENHYRMFHPQLSRSAKETGQEASYCVECDIQYSSVYRYKRHIAQSTKHTPRKRVSVPCPDCGKLFSRTNYMNNHYRLVHSKDTQFHCEICNKFFARGYGLRVHRKYVHEKMTMPKTKMCDICGRGFGTKRILDNHRRTHTGERPYKCSHCPATFAQQTAMKTHQKTQHKNVLTCNIQMDVQ